MPLAGRLPTLARTNGRASFLATIDLRPGEVRDVARRLNDLTHDHGVELVRRDGGAMELLRAALKALPPAAVRQARLGNAIKRRFILAPGAEEPDEHRMEAAQVTGLTIDNVAALVRHLLPALPPFADLRMRSVGIEPGWGARWLWIRQTTSGYIEQITQTWRRGAVSIGLSPMTAETYQPGRISRLTTPWLDAIFRANETHRGMTPVHRCGRLAGWIDENEPSRTHWKPFP